MAEHNTENSHSNPGTDDYIASNDASNNSNSRSREKGGHWTDREHQLFIKALKEHGKSWQALEDAI